MDYGVDKQMQVPYIVHEAAMARQERTVKRLWIVVILLIVLLVATNAGWIWYESQWEVVETTVESQTDGGGQPANVRRSDAKAQRKNLIRSNLPRSVAVRGRFFYATSARTSQNQNEN